jgi:nicotinamide-nucleotide adenylyltransferase
MVVGVTNPDPVLTSDNHADLQRSNPIANPLTYFERYTMIRRVLMDIGLSDSDFSVVPLPINMPELFEYYVPLDGTFFLTIYDEWGRQKLKQFQVMGLKTEVLWERPLNEKGISGNDVRKRMATDNKWEHLVPESTRTLMIKWDIPARIKRLHQL